MGQHSKYTFETKLSAVTKYLEGKVSVESIGRRIGTNEARIVEWAIIYQALGAVWQYIKKNIFSCARTASCCAGTFICPAPYFWSRRPEGGQGRRAALFCAVFLRFPTGLRETER